MIEIFINDISLEINVFFVRVKNILYVFARVNEIDFYL